MGRNAEILLPAGFVVALAKASSTSEVLTIAAGWLPEMIRADRTSISLLEGADHLRLHAFGGSVPVDGPGAFPIDDSLLGTAFTNRSILNVADLADATGQDVAVLRAAGFRSALIAPMISAGSALGTVNAANQEVGHFTEQDELALRSLADLVASFVAAIQHAEQYERRANVDALTGIMSRSAILARLAEAFTDGDHRPSLLYLDVNSFKAINDRHGHLVGDRFLRIFSNRVGELVRSCDGFGRLGGDEFLVVVERDRGGVVAGHLADRITRALEQPIVVGSAVIEPRASIGVATVVSLDDTADELLHDADQTMYSAKVAGLPTTIVSAEIRRQAIMRIATDRDLDDAMEEAALTFHFQPVRDLVTNEIMGAEALIRWNHPEHGPIPPPMLIERVQATGRTDAFTRWSVVTLAHQWAALRAQVPWFWDKAVSLNLAPPQLAWPGFPDFFLATLADVGLRTVDIIVEVVESDEITADDPAERSLTKLGEAGTLIALDDFGTGHNALGYFTRFPIHAIKFDRSLVGAMATHDVARTIVEHLAALALDLEVAGVAEGIETETEALLCRDAGIPLGQGWHLGYPTSLDDLILAARSEDAPLHS